MLVLSRKRNQTICIGDSIRVTVSQIKRGQVRLAIEAPRHVNIRRREILPLDKQPRAEAELNL